MWKVSRKSYSAMLLVWFEILENFSHLSARSHAIGMLNTSLNPLKECQEEKNLKFPQFFLLLFLRQQQKQKHRQSTEAIFLFLLSCFMLVLIINGVCYKWLLWTSSYTFFHALNFSLSPDMWTFFSVLPPQKKSRDDFILFLHLKWARSVVETDIWMISKAKVFLEHGALGDYKLRRLMLLRKLLLKKIHIKNWNSMECETLIMLKNILV